MGQLETSQLMGQRTTSEKPFSLRMVTFQGHGNIWLKTGLGEKKERLSEFGFRH